MATQCRDATVAGLWIEVYDSSGHYLGQAVYFDWWHRPLPSVGDRLTLDLTVPGGSSQPIIGEVCLRQFDVQETPDGQPAVWVRLVTRRIATCRPTTPQQQSATFSAN